VTTEAFRGWQALLETETSPADETLAAAAAAAGQADAEHIHQAIKLFASERCVLKSRMAGVSSYQQGLAGIEFVDFFHSDEAEAAFDAEYEAEAMEELTGLKRWKDGEEEEEEEVVAAADESREILELAEITVVITDSPTTPTARTPEVAQSPNVTRPEVEGGAAPAPAASTKNSTAAITIKARARAALARAKAANRARKEAKRTAAAGNAYTGAGAVPAVETVTTTATVTVKAPVSNTATRRAGRGRGRDGGNHSTVTTTFSAPAPLTAGNQSDKDADGDEDLPVPVAALRGGRRGRLTLADNSRGGGAAADEAGFATGFLYTLGTVGVVVAVIVAGVGVTVYGNDEQAARSSSSSRRVSLAPSLLGADTNSAMSTALGVGFGSLQRRPAAGAGRRCSESLPM